VPHNGVRDVAPETPLHPTAARADGRKPDRGRNNLRHDHMGCFVGEVARGADVGVITIDGEKYIRTERDKTQKDNLGQLPRF